MTTLKVEFGGYTSAGRKAQNQDAFVAQSPTGSLFEHKGAIADGLNSSASAQLAARTCALQFCHRLSGHPSHLMRGAWSLPPPKSFAV
jgi:hypothetical protein